MLSDLLRYDNPSAIAMMFNDVHGTSIYPVDFDIVGRQPGPGPSITFTLQFKHPIDPIYPHRFTGSTPMSLQRIDLTEFFGRSLTMDMFYPTTVHDVLSRIMMGRGDVFDLTEFTNRVLDEEHVILTPKEDSLRWVGELHLELQDPVNTLDILTLAPVTVIDPLHIDRTDYTVRQLAPYKYLGDLGPIIQMGIVVGLVDGSRVTIKGPGDIPGGQVTLSNGTLTITSDEIVSILRWGNYGETVSRYSFMDCVALVDVPNSRPIEITDFSYMFQGCVSLNSPALVNWQTRNVHDAQYMFAGCSVFNQDLSLWCVKQFDNAPLNFDTGATAWALPKPVWGTCPPSAEEPDPEPKPFNGKRPYGESAPWNIPVSGIAVHPQSSTYVAALWDELPSHKTPEFNLRNYTYSVYNAEEATGEYTVTSTNAWGNLNGQKIPFGTDWLPALGSDAQIIILDPDTGTEWNLWGVSDIDHTTKTLTISNGNKCAGNYWENNWDDPATQTSGSRGVGINYLAMLVRPWEIEKGCIEHALSMPIIGTSGSEFWPPATKLEHPGKEGTIPEGARFSLDVTYEEIDDHVDAIAGASEQLKHMVRVLLVALKDYGWFITDTASGQTWQLEALASAESEWIRLGIYPEAYLPIYGQNALHPRFSAGGFLTKERIRLHVPSDQY